MQEDHSEDRLNDPLQYYCIRFYNGTWTEQDKRILCKAMEKASARTRNGVFLRAGRGGLYRKKATGKKKSPASADTLTELAKRQRTFMGTKIL